MSNRFLHGTFAPIREEHTLTELAVTGRIPDFLDGRYLRNGPNPVGAVDPDRYHWFLGDGMVHGIPSPRTVGLGGTATARCAAPRSLRHSANRPSRAGSSPRGGRPRRRRSPGRTSR